jgi:arylsulfatase
MRIDTGNDVGTVIADHQRLHADVPAGESRMAKKYGCALPGAAFGILLGITCFASAAAAQQSTKPNILVIFGDDVGWMNISSYGGDLMGVRTPNIDRIAKEGLRLTSFYAQPSCTAGRAAFITGQLPVRTGLTTVGTPGSPAGLQKEDAH